VLKNVKLPFLNYKRINLPFGRQINLMKDQMNRILLVLLVFSACLSACNKTPDVVAQVKAQAIIDDKIVTDYLNSKSLPINQIDTTGVCYIIDTLGVGKDLFTNSTLVTVGYTGKLLTTGAIFAQTDAFHPSYVLGQVIKGWQLGIPKIKKGGRVTLFIPSRYAYGPYAQPLVNLPANAVLTFDIKLYNVTN
jgi:FKBP-type peptidyl-prolyl cis-trans isomerase FkpA